MDNAKGGQFIRNGSEGGWVLIVRRETQMLNKSVLFLVPFFAQRQMSALAVGVVIGATGTCNKKTLGVLLSSGGAGFPEYRIVRTILNTLTHDKLLGSHTDKR